MSTRRARFAYPTRQISYLNFSSCYSKSAILLLKLSILFLLTTSIISGCRVKHRCTGASESNPEIRYRCRYRHGVNYNHLSYKVCVGSYTVHSLPPTRTQFMNSFIHKFVLYFQLTIPNLPKLFFEIFSFFPTLFVFPFPPSPIQAFCVVQTVGEGRKKGKVEKSEVRKSHVRKNN